MDDKRELRSKQVVVTTAGTAVPLFATSKHVCKLWVKALSTNTGLIYLGDSGVDSSSGYVLQKNEYVPLSSVFAKDNFIMDLGEVYIDSSVNGEGVSILYFE